MALTEYDFILKDRVQKIQSMTEYDFILKSYLSFSGGKDSCVASRLLDMALPGNKIPRVYFNTGIEYRAVLDHVKEMARTDDRIIIVNSGVNIPEMLKSVGYPFKSKEHSQKVAIYQHSGLGKTVLNYIGNGNKDSFLCAEKLKYNFTPDFKLKISDKCCKKLKKEIAQKWSEAHGKTITITGIRKGEGGLRTSIQGCAVFYDDNCRELKKFHPLFPCNDDFINEFIEKEKIKLCKLYYPPYNFKRTGCKGCPFSLDLQKQLDVMACYLPEERRQCEYIWQPVYTEYRRIGYRLENTLFDFS